MIVYEPTLENREGYSTISVKIQWEYRDREEETILFYIPEDYVPESYTINGALAIALSLPALHTGESRIKLSAPIDPIVLNNIRCVLAQHASWFGYNHNNLAIEAETITNVNFSSNKTRAGSFFSGGVDSFWTFKRNHATLPTGHPLRIQDIFFVYGFDIGWKSGEPGNNNLYNETSRLFNEFCKHNNLNNINIRTNIRHIFDDSNFWAARWHGMVLSSIGYLLSNKISDLFVPATNDLWHPDAWGTSPLVEPTLSSSMIHFYHDGADQTRFMKVKYLAQWPDELKLLRVCTKTDDIPDGFLNCGKCEKCLRTKLELVASGIDPETIGSFSTPHIDLHLLNQISPSTLYMASEYEELLDPLKILNKEELIDPINGITEKWKKWSEWKDEKTTTGLLKQLVRKFTKTWPPVPDSKPMKVN